MNRVPVYILAGGHSSRFGSDKARAELDGEPLLRRVARQLECVAASITVVADRSGKYEDLGFRTLGDLHPGRGPLGGLETSLRDLGDHPCLLLCSCDRAVIARDWLSALLAHASDAADAVAFRDQVWQPMPALYSQALLDRVSHQLTLPDRSLQTLLHQSDVAEVHRHGPSLGWGRINRPRDLEACARALNLRMRIP